MLETAKKLKKEDLQNFMDSLPERIPNDSVNMFERKKEIFPRDMEFMMRIKRHGGRLNYFDYIGM